jgi:hypothetical protein
MPISEHVEERVGAVLLRLAELSRNASDATDEDVRPPKQTLVAGDAGT